MIAALALWSALAHAQQIEQLEQTFAFEDIDGAASDMDWNDQNIRWRGVCDLDDQGDVRRHRISFVATTAGAAKTNALMLRVPAGATAVSVDGVAAVPTAGVVRLLDPFKDGFAGGASGFVNTEGAPTAVGVTHEVAITYAPAADFGGGCPVPGFELHRPGEGVVIDVDSRRDGTGPPLAGNFDGTFRAPIERVDIAVAYPGSGPTPGFLAWAADVADGTCDTACGGLPWWDAPDTDLVDPRTAGALTATAPLPPLATCFDGIANGEETGVDCGDAFGACAPCATAREVIAFVGNDGLVHVWQWQDPAWTPLGPSLTDPGGWAQSSTLSLDAGGDPMVAWAGNDGYAHVRAWSGASWSAVGAPIADPGGWVARPALIAGDAPVVAWKGNDGLMHVRRWDGVDWNALGDGIVDPGGGGGGNNPALAWNDLDEPVLAWQGNDGKAHVRAWDGAEWVALGSGIVDPGGWARAPSIVVVSGEPVVAFAGNDGLVHVRAWNGSNWYALGASLGGTGWASAATLSTGNGGLFLGWNAGGARVATWTGVTWSTFGTVVHPTAGSGQCALAVDGSGAPMTAFTSNNDGKVYAMRWGGGGWAPMGSGLTDPGGWARLPAMAAQPGQSSTNRDPFGP